MFIAKIHSQNRRDFRATFECEHCGHTFKSSGYDDRNFHDNVVPDMVCQVCGRKSEKPHQPRETKYPEDMLV